MRTKIVGIYLIECGDRKYVGQSIDLEIRFKEHINDLKTGKHCNRYISRLYEKYGLEYFNFKILQKVGNSICDKASKPQLKHLLQVLEQTWMNIINPELNFCPAAGSPLGLKQSEETIRKLIEKRARDFKFWSPEGDIHEGKNVSIFAEERGLDLSNLIKLLKGKKLHHKGWTASPEAHILYLKEYSERGVSRCNKSKSWILSFTESGKTKRKYFKDKNECLRSRDSLEDNGYVYTNQSFRGWQEKLNILKNLQVN